MATIEPRRQALRDGRVLVIRGVDPDDAAAVIDYVEAISGESDFLSFGPGEFGSTVEQEQEFLRGCQAADNRLFIAGVSENALVSLLTFSGDPRPRNRHVGEFGMSVRSSCWGLGIGAAMLECLLEWARRDRVVTKINLRVRTDNVRAIDLYARKGFVREGTITKDVRVHGRYFDHYLMGLELD